MILICLLVVLSIIYIFNIKNSNLIKLSYSEVIEKVNNKEDFVLCVSASKCVHCKDYKPKLKEISNDYNIKIYFVNVNEFSDGEYETFKQQFSFDGGTPTTIFFKEGVEKTTANRIEGNDKKEKIINKLKSNGFIVE